VELGTFLFGFRGRIGRAAFWLGTSLSLVGMGLAAMAAERIIDAYRDASQNIAVPKGFFVGEAAVTITVLLLLLAVLGFAWVFLAVQVKRWRDRGKNWLWILCGLVPFVGPVWMIYECGFRCGAVSDSSPKTNLRKPS
jgi:uncharacterized membrane protein YhaH (DUF805 family)